MSHRKLQFVDEFVVDLNGAKAVVRAGYSENGARQQANRLLTRVDIQEKIQERFQARQARVELDQDVVIMDLRDLIDRCSKSVPIRDGKGQPTGDEKPVSASAAIMGNELLMRHWGMFIDRTTSLNYNVNLVRVL